MRYSRGKAALPWVRSWARVQLFQEGPLFQNSLRPSLPPPPGPRTKPCGGAAGGVGEWAASRKEVPAQRKGPGIQGGTAGAARTRPRGQARGGITQRCARRGDSRTTPTREIEAQTGHGRPSTKPSGPHDFRSSRGPAPSRRPAPGPLAPPTRPVPGAGAFQAVGAAVVEKFAGCEAGAKL